jgi:hypothetical protein
MTAPEVAELRLEVARLVVAITGSWPGEEVLDDRRELALVAGDAVQHVAALRRERDEFKTSVTELCKQRDERRAEFEQLLREDEAHRERLRELGPIVAALTEGDVLGELERLRAEVKQLRADADHQPREHLAGVHADNPAALPPGTWLAGEGVYALRWFTHPETDHDEQKPWLVLGPWGLDAESVDHDRVRGWLIQACTPNFPTWAPQAVDVSHLPPHEPLPRREPSAALKNVDNRQPSMEDAS